MGIPRRRSPSRSYISLKVDGPPDVRRRHAFPPTASPDVIEGGHARAESKSFSCRPEKAVERCSMTAASAVVRHAMHVDVSVARERAADRLAAARTAGVRIVDESRAPA